MELQLRLPGDWPVGQHRHAPPEPAGEDLESVLTWLREVEINAWISTTPPAHIAAGIHDPYGGEDIRRFPRGRWGLAARRDCPMAARHRAAVLPEGSAVKRPSKLSTDRARRFCSALATETRDRPNWWVSIQTVADRLGMSGDNAIKLADACARAGLRRTTSPSTRRRTDARPSCRAQRDAERGRAKSGAGEAMRLPRGLFWPASLTTDAKL